MIYLNTTGLSGLGEDTFWTWFMREFPDVVVGAPTNNDPNDVVLHYSRKGENVHPNAIAILWELYPEMGAMLNSNIYKGNIHVANKCARTCRRRVVSSEVMVPYYERFGKVDVLPIGVDTDLFVPMDKKTIRDKNGICPGMRNQIGVWVGTDHEMKGYDLLLKYANEHPEIFWIIIWKSDQEKSMLGRPKNFVEYNKVTQQKLAELFNCADFFFSSGRLRPFFMVEWEAMACDLPFVIPNGITREFIPNNRATRMEVFGRGWARIITKEIWGRYLYE